MNIDELNKINELVQSYKAVTGFLSFENKNCRIAIQGYKNTNGHIYEVYFPMKEVKHLFKIYQDQIKQELEKLGFKGEIK